MARGIQTTGSAKKDSLRTHRAIMTSLMIVPLLRSWLLKMGLKKIKNWLVLERDGLDFSFQAVNLALMDSVNHTLSSKSSSLDHDTKESLRVILKALRIIERDFEQVFEIVFGQKIPWD